MLGSSLPTAEVSTRTSMLELLGSNFSEKPLVSIGGLGPNGMAGGSQEQGQRSGVEASLAAMQNSIAQLAASISNTYTPQGKGAPPERATRTTEEISSAWAAQPTTGQHAVYANPVVGNCPRGHPPRNLPHRPRDRGSAARLRLPRVLWASSGLSNASVAKGSSGQADNKEKDKPLMTQKADRLAHIFTTLPELDHLQEDFQSQLDQLRNDLRDPRQPGARLDSAIAKQRKGGAKVQKCKEALKQAEEALQSAQEKLRVESR